jgi:hypothetical protein
MKKIDLSTLRDKDGKIPLLTRLKKTFSGGSDWVSELDAQDLIMMRLGNTLGDDFTLIREIKLPGLDTPIPMALVGPPGVLVLYASAAKGTYRARGDAWLKLDNAGNMHISHPNLPTRTRLYAEAVRKFLAEKDVPATDIEAVLLFTQPEAFVENIKAPIRIVMSDGLESYGNSLRLLNPIFSSEERANIIRLLSNPEGKLTVTEEIAAESEEIAPQQVIMPSAEPELPDFLRNIAEAPPEESLHNVFVEEAQEAAPPPPNIPTPSSIPLPPVIEEAIEQGSGFRLPFSDWIARTHMKSWQVIFLGVGALFDFLFIAILFILVILRMPR